MCFRLGHFLVSLALLDAPVNLERMAKNPWKTDRAIGGALLLLTPRVFFIVSLLKVMFCVVSLCFAFRFKKRKPLWHYQYAVSFPDISALPRKRPVMAKCWGQWPLLVLLLFPLCVLRIHQSLRKEVLEDKEGLITEAHLARLIGDLLWTSIF